MLYDNGVNAVTKSRSTYFALLLALRRTRNGLSGATFKNRLSAIWIDDNKDHLTVEKQ